MISLPAANRNGFVPAALLACCLLLAIAGCNRNQTVSGEVAYVSAVQATLRDRVAAVYNKTGAVSNGEKVAVLEHAHNGRFVRVRNARGEEGWLEQRYLAGEPVFQGFQQLGRQNAAIPSQATATTRADLNMHLAPSRDSEHLFQLKEGEKLQLLKRATAPKSGKSDTSAATTVSAQTPAPAAYEDWWLVRDAQKRYGWVLARMVDLDVPLEVAQYAEGQRIVAAFVLNNVPDAGKPVAQYLLLLNEPKDGMPQDFNQLRVFTWNAKRHHYETAYRERNLFGVLPAHAGTADFGKEGTLPAFTVQLRDGSGSLEERQYKLNGVMVRRVLAPGQRPPAQRAHTGRRRS